MSILTFKENQSVMKFSFNPWDSKPFDRPCYELEATLGNKPASPEAVLNFIRENKLETVTCRAETSDFKLRCYLQSMGFLHVELQLICRLALSKNMAPKSQFGQLRLAESKDIHRVKEIASKIFLQSRFRCIPNLSSSKIGHRFSNWVSQLQNEFPDYAYVLEINDEILGFFYSKPSENSNELYAALGGIANDSKGPYGIYLYPAVMAAYFNSDIKNVVSAIAADNLGALNLWAGLGTRFPQAFDIYMWNIENQPI